MEGILVRKPEVKKPFEKPCHRWEGSVKMDVRGMMF
jgi:hypothetical protein